MQFAITFFNFTVVFDTELFTFAVVKEMVSGECNRVVTIIIITRIIFLTLVLQHLDCTRVFFRDNYFGETLSGSGE